MINFHYCVCAIIKKKIIVCVYKYSTIVIDSLMQNLIIRLQISRPKNKGKT